MIVKLQRAIAYVLLMQRSLMISAMTVMSMVRFLTALINPLNYIGGVSFNPDRDIPDLSGKVQLVTGGNAGLGKETIRQLAKHNPSKIFLAARSETKATDAIEEIKATISRNTDTEIIWLPLDLTSNKSVLDAARQFRDQSERLHILVLNAGVMCLPPGETEMGHDIQFGTNHTGHFLFVKLLLPTLLRTAEEPNSDVRVVTLSSNGHNFAPSFNLFLDQNELKRIDTRGRYGVSKAANILFAAELSRRYPSIMSVSVHPGMISTNLYNALKQSSLLNNLGSQILLLFGSSVLKGAYNTLWAAVAARQHLVNGSYYVPVGNIKKFNKYVQSEEMGKLLWDWTDHELGKENLK